MKGTESIGNIGGGANNILTELAGLPRRAWDTAGAAWSKSPKLKTATLTEMHTPAILTPAKVSAEFGFNIIKQPFTIAGGWIGHGLDKVSKGIHNYPLLATAAIVGGGIYGVRRLVNGSAEERTQREFQQELAKLNAIQAQQQYPAPVANTYINNPAITEEDMRTMEAKLAAKRAEAGGLAGQVKPPTNENAPAPAAAARSEL